MIQPDHPADIGSPDNPHRRSNGHSTDSLAAGPLRPPSFEASPTAQTDDAPPEILSTQEIAVRFGEAAGGIYLASCVGAVMAGLGDPSVMAQYMQDLTRECNAQHDPLQRLLLEQIVVAFHRVGSMHSNAANAKSPELMLGYNAGATKLLGELRKCLLTLRELQAVPLSGGTFRKISRAEQQPAPSVQQNHVTEQTSNTDTEATGGKRNGPRHSTDNSDKEPKTSSSRPHQSEKEAGTNTNRKAKAADIQPDSPTLVTVNGTSHSRW